MSEVSPALDEHNPTGAGVQGLEVGQQGLALDTLYELATPAATLAARALSSTA